MLFLLDICISAEIAAGIFGEEQCFRHAVVFYPASGACQQRHAGEEPLGGADAGVLIARDAESLFPSLRRHELIREAQSFEYALYPPEAAAEVKHARDALPGHCGNLLKGDYAFIGVCVPQHVEIAALAEGDGEGGRGFRIYDGKRSFLAGVYIPMNIIGASPPNENRKPLTYQRLLLLVSYHSSYMHLSNFVRACRMHWLTHWRETPMRAAISL